MKRVLVAPEDCKLTCIIFLCQNTLYTTKALWPQVFTHTATAGEHAGNWQVLLGTCHIIEAQTISFFISLIILCHSCKDFWPLPPYILGEELGFSDKRAVSHHFPCRASWKPRSTCITPERCCLLRQPSRTARDTAPCWCPLDRLPHEDPNPQTINRAGKCLYHLITISNSQPRTYQSMPLGTNLSRVDALSESFINRSYSRTPLSDDYDYSK